MFARPLRPRVEERRHLGLSETRLELAENDLDDIDRWRQDLLGWIKRLTLAVIALAAGDRGYEIIRSLL